MTVFHWLSVHAPDLYNAGAYIAAGIVAAIAGTLASVDGAPRG